jgi:hypothetical protein
MCGLCGVLGGDGHWTEGSNGRGPEDAGRTRRHERLNRVKLVNRVLERFALRLDDWQGAAFVLTSGTGKREIVDNLSALWRAAEALSGRRLDPLDPELLAVLASADRAGPG